MDDVACAVCDLHLELPALNAEDVIQPLRDCSRVGVGERHPCSPWSVLQVLLFEWRQERRCDVLAHLLLLFSSISHRAFGAVDCSLLRFLGPSHFTSSC